MTFSFGMGGTDRHGALRGRLDPTSTDRIRLECVKLMWVRNPPTPLN
jgi:hypothetical protein